MDTVQHKRSLAEVRQFLPSREIENLDGRRGICGIFLAQTGNVLLTAILALTACKGKNSK